MARRRASNSTPVQGSEMPAILIDSNAGGAAVPITAVSPQTLSETAAKFDPRVRAWLSATGFLASPGSIALLPDDGGGLDGVLLGLGEKGAAGADPLIAGVLGAGLPAGTYRLVDGFGDPAIAALAVLLGGYRFGDQRKSEASEIRLVLPDGVDGDDLRRVVNAIYIARDLINTPANQLGPAELAAATEKTSKEHDADFAVIVGDALIAEGFPLIHAVGAAAAPGREPRLIDLIWGDPAAPKVTLVGKGVCFDTGGLDIKPSSGMLLMKKDMGGAANALALASMIMGAGLPVRLRLLIPAVENSISAAAFRPGDVLESRRGLSVEIGNTDAEGRLVLADALALASDEDPDLLLDFATLTGAARVALGPDLPAVFTPDDALAEALSLSAEAVADPVWRLPLWSPYAAMIDSKVADINNAGKGGFAGSITAALFLSRFVGDGIPWLHADIYGWRPKAAPAGPEGGEAQTIRAVFDLLKRRYERR